MADLPQPYDSLVQPITALCSAMIALTTVVVLARFWIRLRLVKARLETHDWCILAAWAFAVTSASVSVYRKQFLVRMINTNRSAESGLNCRSRL